MPRVAGNLMAEPPTPTFQVLPWDRLPTSVGWRAGFGPTPWWSERPEASIVQLPQQVEALHTYQRRA